MYQNSRPRRSKPKRAASPKGAYILAALFLIAALLAGGLLFVQHKNKGGVGNNPQQTDQTPPFNKSRYSLTDPTSPWVVVNKKRPLQPMTYAPADLRTPAMEAGLASQQVNDQTAAALENLSRAAAGEGIHLRLVSGYRSYSTQMTIYDSEVRGYGQAQADRESARPGYSEHQSGWAADLGTANGKCDVKSCFADTAEGKWLAANAYKYGFILRYADGKEHVTGYMYEPWHVRYVGTELSTEMHRIGIQTLEEFFNLPAAPDY